MCYLLGITDNCLGAVGFPRAMAQTWKEKKVPKYEKKSGKIKFITAQLIIEYNICQLVNCILTHN